MGAKYTVSFQSMFKIHIAQFSLACAQTNGFSIKLQKNANSKPMRQDAASQTIVVSKLQVAALNSLSSRNLLASMEDINSPLSVVKIRGEFI